jgi:UDP-glucose 4-epimerase
MGRVLVTGGAGFIGSHLVHRLAAGNDPVLVADDLSSGRRDWLPAGVAFERVDIAEPAIERVIRAWRPSLVFHLAAQASVARSHGDPERDLAVNVLGTLRVARAAAAVRATRLVFVSSGGAVYGETRRAATETTPAQPRSIYGIHKLAGEGHVRLAGLSHAVVRPSNVYGPRQTGGLEGAVVAAFVEQIATGRLEIHGDGRQTRDFVHVRDVVEALTLLGSLEVDGTWNVCGGRSTSINQLATIVERESGTVLQRSFHPRRAGDVDASLLSNRRLRALGWRPGTTLRAGLLELIARDSTIAPAAPAARHAG